MSDDYQPPFDDADADVILRSSDGVDFRVYKVILSKASLFFKDMFTLPPPSPDSQDDYKDDYKDGAPIITLSEDSASLDLLLRFCYPVEDPTLSTIEDVETVMEIGRKYDIDFLTNAAKKALLSFADADLTRKMILDPSKSLENF